MSTLPFLYYTRDALRVQLRAQKIMCRIAQDKYRDALQCEKVIEMCEGIIQEFDQEIELHQKLHEFCTNAPYNVPKPMPDIWIPDSVLDEIDQKDAKK